MIRYRSPIIHLFSLCLLVAACLIPTACSTAHPFHLCVAQMKWNADSNLWELSIRLHPQDLENALTKELYPDKPNQRLSIDDDSFPEIATKYLEHHFYLRRTSSALKREELKAILDSTKSELWAKAKVESTTKDDASKERSSLKWVGMEQERGWLWIHLELSAPSVDDERHKLWFINRILIDSVERQENTVAIDPVSIDSVAKKFSLQFRSGEELHEMKATK